MEPTSAASAAEVELAASLSRLSLESSGPTPEEIALSQNKGALQCLLTAAKLNEQKKFVDAAATAQQGLALKPTNIDLKAKLNIVLGSGYAGQGYHGHAFMGFFRAGLLSEKLLDTVETKIRQLNKEDCCYQIALSYLRHDADTTRLQAPKVLQYQVLDAEQTAFINNLLALSFENGPGRIKNTEKALKAVNAGIRAMPKNKDVLASLYMSQAAIHFYFSRYQEAQDAARKAVELHPVEDDVEARNNLLLIQFCIKNDNYTEALTRIETLRKTNLCKLTDLKIEELRIAICRGEYDRAIEEVDHELHLEHESELQDRSWRVRLIGLKARALNQKKHFRATIALLEEERRKIIRTSRSFLEHLEAAAKGREVTSFTINPEKVQVALMKAHNQGPLIDDISLEQLQYLARAYFFEKEYEKCLETTNLATSARFKTLNADDLIVRSTKILAIQAAASNGLACVTNDNKEFYRLASVSAKSGQFLAKVNSKDYTDLSVHLDYAMAKLQS